MTDKLNFDDAIHKLRLGKSFDNNGGGLAFHSLRYDFKPQSLDLTQTATVEIGQGNSVTVKVPHQANASTTHTEYRGNKKSCMKECVLIIDHVTGEFTLEKLDSNIQLKSTRSRGPSKQGKESAPAATNSKPAVTKSPVKKMKTNNGTVVTAVSSQVNNHAAAAAPAPAPAVNHKAEKQSLTDDSSDSDSSSDDDSDDSSSPTKSAVSAAAPAPTAAGKKTSHSFLCEDLRLSDSDSD